MSGHDRNATNAGGKPLSASIETVLAQARAMREAGKIFEAMALLQAALATHPEDWRLHHTLGLLHRADEDSAAAIECLKQAVHLAPNSAKSLHALARATMEAGLPAFDLHEQARAFSPNDPELLIGRSAAQLAEGHGADAIADLEAILIRNADWVDGQAQLARLRWMLGNRDRFVDGFVRALKIRPAQPALWTRMIDLLIEAELFDDADRAVMEARRACGPSVELEVREAICASELGDCERADSLFERLAPVREGFLGARYMRHMLRTGRFERAASCGEALIEAPAAEQIWPYLSLAWRLVGDERHAWLEGNETLVGVYDLADRIDVDTLSRRLNELHVTVQDMAGQSVRGGTQTDGPLFARIEPEIRELRAVLVETVRRHSRSLSPLDLDHPVLQHRADEVRFSGSWSVRLRGGGRHTNHIHPLGWFSSALYVRVPAVAEAGEPPSGWLTLGSPPEELGLNLPAFRQVEPKPGRLVLFPSMMWHGTIPFQHGERMTVAFDVARPT